MQVIRTRASLQVAGGRRNRAASPDVGQTYVLGLVPIAGGPQTHLAERGETHRNGTPIRFLPPPEEQNNGQTALFPCTACASLSSPRWPWKGRCRFRYCKSGRPQPSADDALLHQARSGPIEDVLLGAAERLEARKESIQNFLLDLPHTTNCCKKPSATAYPTLPLPSRSIRLRATR